MTPAIITERIPGQKSQLKLNNPRKEKINPGQKKRWIKTVQRIIPQEKVAFTLGFGAAEPSPLS